MSWTISDVIERTLGSFGRNWVALVVGNLVAMLIAFLPAGLCAAIVLPPLYKQAQSGGPGELVVVGSVAPLFLSVLASLVLSCLFAPALSRMALAAARGERPRVAQVFDFRRAGTLLGAGFLSALAVMGATLLFIVPGIIVGVALSLVSFFVVDDARLDAFDALRASREATRGHRLRLFGLFVVAAAVNVALHEILQSSVWLAPFQLALALAWPPLMTLGLANVYLSSRPQRSAPVVAG